MGFGEILVILVIALLEFGPDRLPTMIKEAAAFIRDLRTMVAKARNDLGDSFSDLGIDKEDLEILRQLRDPKSYLRQQVLDGVDLGLDDPELEESVSLDNKSKRTSNGARAKTSDSNGSTPPAVTKGTAPATNGHAAGTNGDGAAATNGDAAVTSADPAAGPPPFDPEAT